MVGPFPGHGAMLANPETRIMCEAIEAVHRGPGLSKREAFAEAVVELELGRRELSRLPVSGSSGCYDECRGTQTRLKKSRCTARIFVNISCHAPFDGV